MREPSTRAKVITRRTYNRPLNPEGTQFESWEATVRRVIKHQRWLWERAQGHGITFAQAMELGELERLMLAREVSVSGRTLWLGGTDVAMKREASQFNCSFSRTATVHDVVDHKWLLLQGCGVGGLGGPGVLNGFAKAVSEVLVIRSKLTIEDWENGVRGDDKNRESFTTEDGKRIWRLRIGDSAEAWAKSVGKLLAMKKPVDVIVLDYSQIRAAGIRLSGYGWISSGDATIHKAHRAICDILSARAGKLLTRMDILDIENWLGTTLSSRRSAEIMLCPYGDDEWEEFALAKKDYWKRGNDHRRQSNNSLLFYKKPTKAELFGIFHLMMLAGGSEPGFINAEAAKRRAPWFVGVNPCAEILLGDKSFCNLVEVDVSKFNGRYTELHRAVYLAARANYRQTCVDLRDGILQDSWHELNEYLRLQGVGLTGLVQWEVMKEKDHDALALIRTTARNGGFDMADELGLPRPKAVTTVKPSGTLSKVMDTTEGVHKPLGKYIFNWANFSKHDPLIPLLKEAGYRVMDNPMEEDGVLVCFPVSYEGVDFETVEINGRVVEVNRESAVEQLERYKFMMDHYVDHNCSVTISYSPEEVPEIVDWIFDNWDSYVGVSFIYRNDPTKTAADLGYAYLPQEVVTREDYEAYVATLQPVDIDAANSLEELRDEGCSTGACPIR